jgi:tetratricopeptide (TPR) repeat protein
MKIPHKLILVFICISSGCTVFHRGNSGLDGISKELDGVFAKSDPAKTRRGRAKVESEQVANPRASTIRFDGHEVVLGNAAVTQISRNEFDSKLTQLLQQEKYFSARQFVLRHRNAGEQILWEHWGTRLRPLQVQFLASVLSEGVAVSGAWTGLLAAAAQRPNQAQSYFRARADFIERLKTGNGDATTTEALRKAAQELSHQLAMSDAFQLIAVQELVSGNNTWAESLFRQSIEIASGNRDHTRVAALYLLAATAASKSGQFESAKEHWHQAIQSQIAYAVQSNNEVMHTDFWVRAEEQRPATESWPRQISNALASAAAPTGCLISDDTHPELVLWSAVGLAQYDADAPQLALVSFKRAETFASESNVAWLRVAQGKCLAALGQGSAAAAILSAPSAHEDATIAAAATAAMGSAKLLSGAYQQGAQLLNKALSADPSLAWPLKVQAEADLALAQLIIGDTEQGLVALRLARQHFEQLGDTASMLQAIENEVQILELENRTSELEALRSLNRTIESNPSSSQMTQLGQKGVIGPSQNVYPYTSTVLAPAEYVLGPASASSAVIRTRLQPRPTTASPRR